MKGFATINQKGNRYTIQIDCDRKASRPTKKWPPLYIPPDELEELRKKANLPTAEAGETD